mgnify:CR=1 FL=1
MLFNLILTVLFMFLFSYYANLLGQNVVYDIRIKLFKHILDFKMGYFDKSSVGRLVTRAVNDMETIASIFSQGLFMIVADLLQMLLVIIVMLALSWKLSLTIFDEHVESVRNIDLENEGNEKKLAWINMELIDLPALHEVRHRRLRRRARIGRAPRAGRPLASSCRRRRAPHNCDKL